MRPDSYADGNTDGHRYTDGNPDGNRNSDADGNAYRNANSNADTGSRLRRELRHGGSTGPSGRMDKYCIGRSTVGDVNNDT